MIPRVLATICARAGSRGVPWKNIRPLNGKPLLLYAIECAQACPAVGCVVVSTDSDEIAAVAESAGVRVPFRRPSQLASDTAPKILAIRHAAEYAEANHQFFADIIVDLDVSAPLRVPQDVTACVDCLCRHEVDAVVTVYEAERSPYFNMVEFDGDCVKLVKTPPRPIVRRQDAPPVFSVSGSVFAFRRDRLYTVTHLYDGRWGGCVVPRERAVDIDHELDFQFAEFLLTNARARPAS